MNEDSEKQVNGNKARRRVVAAAVGEIVLPCYEGADGRATELTFSNPELCRSILLLGSTGAGKTTAVRAICRSLIRQRAADATSKPAFIPFDFKGDWRTVDAITAWAEQAGQEDDTRRDRAVASLRVGSSRSARWRTRDLFGAWHYRPRWLVSESERQVLIACRRGNIRISGAWS